MKILRVLAVAVVVSLLGLLVWSVAHDEGGAAEKVDQGKVVAAPNFRLPLLEGDGKLALASLRGKVVVLNFWQSYCPPCKDEAPEMQAAHRRWQARGVEFVGVDVQDFKKPARAFVQKYGITYRIVRDGGSTIGPFGVTGFPETFFVDRRGRIVPPHVIGPASRKDLDTGIRRALASSAA